jgi:sulfhydrogenase subunit beta (sulfur reductase)
MPLFYITSPNLISFIQSFLRQYRIYGLIAEGDDLFWQKLNVDNISNISITRYRALTPVKSFFFPLKEDLGNELSEVNTMLIGVKSCDLNHLKTTDVIFSEGVISDPYYAKKREETIIISSDCDRFKPSCFCTLMGEAPYATKGFDLNLTPTRSGYLVETGSQRGQALVASRKHYFQDPQPVLIQERDLLRSKMMQAVSTNNELFNWTNPNEIVSKYYLSEKWENDIASTCVECDACRFSCGTCYCFLLSETNVLWGKTRTWDSCQSTGYARVAGGGNPKKTRGARLRNLYTCKLVYRHDNFGFFACTGCGRCIDACQGKIDIRQSLQKLFIKDKQTNDKKPL